MLKPTGKEIFTVGDDYYLGLKPYFELTGLAYKITPQRNANGRERVNTEVMYDNMMHKFKFGNMNMPGIYIDENLMRMCRHHRMMFADLAEALYREGKRDQVREVLDYSEQMLPEYNIPYDYTSASMASLYYLLGTEEDKAKATEMMTKVADNSVEYIIWGDSLSKEQRKAAQNVLNHQTAVLGYALQQMERNGQRDLVEEYYPIYASHAQ